jgi:hypothetical protein
VGAPRVDWQTLKPRLASVLWLGLASLCCYFLARLFLLKLFIPDRYLQYTLNLFYCLGLGLCLHAALKMPRWPRALGIGVLVAAAALGGWRLHGLGLKDYAAYQPLYAALEHVPAEALVAGHPNLMDNVPTFAQRRALAIYELAHPWATGWWRQLQPRLDDLFRAYYAADPQEVVKLAQKYGVAFMVVDDRHFTPEFLAGQWRLFPYDQDHAAGTPRGLRERAYCPFFAPFDAHIRRLAAGRERFALLNWPPAHTQQIDAHLSLIDLRPLQTPAARPAGAGDRGNSQTLN